MLCVKNCGIRSRTFAHSARNRYPSIFFARVDHRLSVFDYASMAGLTQEQMFDLANAEDNLCLTCVSCNAKKGEADLEENPQLTFDCSDEPLKLGPEQIAALKAAEHKRRSTAKRKRDKILGSEGRSAISKKSAETRGPEGRSAAAKKRAENMGHEKLSAAAKKARETLGPEGRSAAKIKRDQTLGPEGLSAAAKKRAETLGPERRSAVAKKARKKQIEALGPDGLSDVAKETRREHGS